MDQSITFVASANCGLYCGARVDFVDIDPRTYNLCPVALERKLTSRARGPSPQSAGAGAFCWSILRYAGHPRSGAALWFQESSRRVARRWRGVSGEPVGACRYSDVTVFSFHPVKIITTAEGGMALTNSVELADRMARLRSHGVTRDPASMTHEPDGAWYDQQIELGMNYRMTELQAALGLSQLSRLDDYVARRRQIALRYDEKLASLPVTTPHQSSDGQCALHLYPIWIDPMRMVRGGVFDRLRGAHIGVNVHYIPVYTQPYYRRHGFASAVFPASECYYAAAISIPMFASLTERQQIKSSRRSPRRCNPEDDGHPAGADGILAVARQGAR